MITLTEHREPVWLTVQEYAQTRKLSERTVWRLIKAEKLQVDRISPRIIRIRLTRIDRRLQTDTQ
jgi:hypothetical protein